jgi:hypothetical protein
MDDSVPSTPPPARRLPSAAGAVLIVCIALSYFVHSCFRPVGEILGRTAEYHALQARGFLAGRTSLPVEPAPELLALKDPYDYKVNQPYRLHDTSLYRGKYYLYFGPAPALLLFLPYRVLTGRDLPNFVAVPLLCTAGFLCACALLYLLAGHNGWDLAIWLELCAISLLGTSSFVFFLVNNARFYEVAVAAGYLFVHAAFLCLFLALRSREPRAAWLAASGLLFGFAIGSRPDLLIAAGTAGAAIAYRFWGRWRVKLIFAAGILLCAAGLAWFNYVRFGNPLETGIQYQLTDAYGKGIHLSLGRVLPTLGTYLFTPPAVRPGFPFLRPNWVTVDPRFPLYVEPFVGILPAAPVLLLGIFAPVFFKLRTAAEADVLRAMHAAAVLLLLFLALTGYVTGRYLVDFAPLLAFCSAISLLSLWGSLGARRPALCSATIVALCAYSLVVLTAMPAPRIASLGRYFSGL